MREPDEIFQPALPPLFDRFAERRATSPLLTRIRRRLVRRLRGR